MKFFIAILVASLSSINFSISMENFQKDIRSKIFHTKNITNSREIIIIDNDENEDKKRKSSDDLNHPNNKKRKTLAELSIKQINRKKEESAEELNKREEVCKNTPHNKTYDHNTPFYLIPKAKNVELSPIHINLARINENGQGAPKTGAKTVESPTKIIKQIDIPSTSPFPKKPEKKDIAYKIDKRNEITPKIQYADPNINYLTGSGYHSKHLLEGIKKSKESIIITTYMLDINKKYHPKLCKQLESASHRGVDITIYFNHYHENEWRSERTQEIFSSITHKLYHIGNHAKGFIIDNNQFCMGSFNWLSDYNDKNKDDESEDSIENISLILNGELSRDLANEFASYARKYQSMTINSSNRDTEAYGGHLFGDKHNTFNNLFKEDERYKNIERSIDLNNYITLLTTPNQHFEFMINAFKASQIKIEIHSPFISTIPKELEERLPKEKIKLFTRAGKKLKICYSKDIDASLLKGHLDNFTNGIKMENVKLSPRTMHQKLFLIDNNTIAIGSFNWLSSPFEIADGKNNEFNATLVLRGEIAVKAITHFRNKRIID